MSFDDLRQVAVALFKHEDSQRADESCGAPASLMACGKRTKKEIANDIRFILGNYFNNAAVLFFVLCRHRSCLVVDSGHCCVQLGSHVNVAVALT